jgi:hypothetical protein
MKDAIERLLEAEVKTFEYSGEQFRFRRLTAGEGLALQEAAAALPEDKPLDYLALLISKTMVEPDGSLGMDSDDGRRKLASLPVEALIALYTAAGDWNGLTESKKN